MSNDSRRPAADDPNAASKEDSAHEALSFMQQALDLLDKNEGPDDAGAHLDYAINRLKEWIENGGDGAS